MFKAVFNVPYSDTVAANSPQGLCIPEPSGIQPKLGETWIVDKTRRISTRSFYIRLVRQWRGLISDYESIQKGQPDFRRGMLVFRDGISFPLAETAYARLWEDYKALLSNNNAVIIHPGIAVRWRKKGKPPEELPLYRFATKYKQQPLLGAKGDIDYFLKSLNRLIAQAVEESQLKKAMASSEIGLLQEAR
ncbi:hypothetical protein ACOBQJ_06940 [Pelotomaculum propionicicum]|uniref:hypothetical protein n=1 Tax=Pelotomaculum propionicicum TaxID=258475 RepID=UPI003B7C9205